MKMNVNEEWSALYRNKATFVHTDPTLIYINVRLKITFYGEKRDRLKIMIID